MTTEIPGSALPPQIHDLVEIASSTRVHELKNRIGLMSASSLSNTKLTLYSLAQNV